MSRCWSVLINHRGGDSRPAASHGHVPNPTGPDVDKPSGGGEVPESARSRTDRPGKQRWGEREAIRATTSTKSPASTRQKCNDEDYRPQERRRATTNPGSASGGGGAPRTQFLSDFSRSDFNTGTYICEDSQTTASRSATTGGCPPMLKLFMIGIKIKKIRYLSMYLSTSFLPVCCRGQLRLESGRSRWLAFSCHQAAIQVLRGC